MPKEERTAIVSDKTEFMRDLVDSTNDSLKEKQLTIGTGGFYESAPYFILTGIPQLDYAVGGRSHPGIPGGRLVEVFGAEGSGKSTLGVWIANCFINQLDSVALYQDAEMVLTEEIIRGTGLNINRVIQSNPEILEKAFQQQQKLIDKYLSVDKKDRSPLCIVLDSVAALSTEKEINGEFGDAPMAEHARIISQAMRKLVDKLHKAEVLSVYVNQVRDKMNASGWGDNTTTPGGRAIPFYSSVRIKLTRVGQIKKTVNGKEAIVGFNIQAQIVKNKVAPPLKKADFDILFIEDDEGSYPKFDTTSAVISWLKDNGLIEGKSGRYEIEGKSLYLSEAKKLLEEDAELMAKYVEMAYSI